MKPQDPRSPSRTTLLRNPLSILGTLIAGIATVFGLPMMFLDMWRPAGGPYLGVLVYLVLPVVATGGAVLMAIGALLERRRRRNHPESKITPLPRIDLNRRDHQAVFVVGLSLVMITVILMSITGYRAYHFTESSEFCGTTCHQVMRPQYTAYQHSPHARVSCAQCHVGPGASWFVRSKFSGLYQVYATLANKYPRPIPTPIKSLRPAPETCEQCHWPEKFFGAEQKTFSHYLTDEANSPWTIQMLLKVGGGAPETGVKTGIHWHMNISKQIEYVAADERRLVIPWVRTVDEHGEVNEYMSTELPLSLEEIASGEIHRMDCMDCHNRPSHIYWPPSRAVEIAMESGQLDASLPYLKREAIRLLTGDYQTEEEGMESILKGLAAFYQKEYPELYRERAAAIRQTTERLQELYARNFFPEMKVDWKGYPNHLGHKETVGCFRCHDGLHQSASGKVITKDCNACHTILAQGPGGVMETPQLAGQPFEHPVDLGMDVTEMNCSDCHTGAGGL